MGETKVIYHLDDQETPYLVKLPIPAERVTLLDLKNALKKPNYKFFFKSMDDDFGVVKEEITDDNAKLPCYNGRVICWLVSSDGSHSDGCSVAESQSERPPSHERSQGIGDSRPPSFHPKAAGSRHGADDETETDSVVSHRRDRDRSRRKHSHEHSGGRQNGYSRGGRGMDLGGYDICDSRSSLMSSELESSSCFDSDDGSTSRFSSVTEQSGSSKLLRRHRRRRRRPKAQQMDRSSSFSSITDSTMSLNIITVTLNMEKYNFLGISIVGQSNERGDGGIYIGSIMKGGAVAADGRIEPGDMLLQVNDINFENMCNDDAVRVLREIVHKPGPVSLTVAKCWDPNPNSCFALPRSEPIRPIDPAAWVSHTAAMTGVYPAYGISPSMSTVTSTSSSISSSIPETERFDDYHLSVHSDMATVAKAMACPDSGLEVRDRMWLKITIANAFIGSDVVDWLFHHVEGFADRREARKYASNLLKAGFIRHTVNKITFSEQCYYIFGDLSGNMAHLSLNDHDGSSGASDQDTLAPLLHPAEAPWPAAFPYQYPPAHSHADAAHSYSEAGGGSAGSQHSEGSSGSNCSWSRTEGKTAAGDFRIGGGSDMGDAHEFDFRRDRAPSERSAAAPSEGSVRSSRSHSYSQKQGSARAAPGSPSARLLASIPPELTGSRRSCNTANGEFFVDIM
ncbi:segment polarity protein dishevelled homolog DVL-3a [Pimephales promelas]|uniref:segment polarity protein dishevelled homolog DVL-3a n=1 Tax=Pimephales promelas TaxID=90988 RepID=UPI001955BAFD|nr:segment polarity protein dishevelled homolog DVL-3a [Pimephales promelas]KAG1969181.1 segment polarity protein dishevelled DVL-3 [Pimephales promelas]